MASRTYAIVAADPNQAGQVGLWASVPDDTKPSLKWYGKGPDPVGTGQSHTVSKEQLAEGVTLKGTDGACEFSTTLKSKAPEGPGGKLNELVKVHPTSWVYADHRQAPLHPRSDEAVKSLIVDLKKGPHVTVGLNNEEYCFTVLEVDDSTPREDVLTDDRWASDRPDYKTILKGVPVPPGASGDSSSDGSMFIHKPSTGELWAFWQARRRPDGRLIVRQAGYVADTRKSVSGQHKHGYGVAACGLLEPPLMITVKELMAGSVDHALYLAVGQKEVISGPVWPATRSDGYTPNGGTILKEGMRFRLKPGTPKPANLTRFASIVFDTLAKGHPLIIADRVEWTGGAMSLEWKKTLPLQGLPEDAHAQFFVRPDGTKVERHAVLRDLPWDQLELVDPGFMAPAKL